MVAPSYDRAVSADPRKWPCSLRCWLDPKRPAWTTGHEVHGFAFGPNLGRWLAVGPIIHAVPDCPWWANDGRHAFFAVAKIIVRRGQEAEPGDRRGNRR